MFRTLFSLLALTIFFYFVWTVFIEQTFPCQTKYYSIGQVDPRFGFTQKEFEKAVDLAANTWNVASGLPLFESTDQGGMVVSAVYDQRQAARNKLKELDSRLTAGRKSFETLKKQYDDLYRRYMDVHAQFTQIRSSYDALKTTFERDLATAKSVGITREDEQRFIALQTQINDLADQANEKQEEARQLANTINAIVGALKQSAAEGQASLGQVAEVDATLGDEYEQGVHEEDVLGERITVFSFEDPTELIQLLTHEFGHAVGIGHLSDSGAIMYYLNYTGRTGLTPSDIAALEEQCKTPPQRLLEWLTGHASSASKAQ